MAVVRLLLGDQPGPEVRRAEVVVLGPDLPAADHHAHPPAVAVVMHLAGAAKAAGVLVVRAVVGAAGRRRARQPDGADCGYCEADRKSLADHESPPWG